MATVTDTAAQSQSPAEPSRQLWNGRKLPYIRVSGPVGSGKTLFGLSIDPNVFKPGAPQTTVVWDLEGSSEPYEDQLNFERRDLLVMVRKRANGGAYKPIDVYLAWVEDLISLPTGKYTVGIVDPFTDVENGLVEWVKKNPGKFDCTAGQFQNASSMFLWPAIKSWSKQLLMSQLRPRFETFVTSHHLKNVWQGGKKTNDTTAEGLDVLEKLATLHVELDRKPPAGSSKARRVPRGEVLKERIIDTETGEILPVLPPVLPQCTPKAIREYILHPADYDNLKPEEQALDHSMTADQRLVIQAGIADANRDSAQAVLASQQAVIGMPQTGAAAVVAAVGMPATTAAPTQASAAAIIDPANFYAEATTEAAAGQQQPANQPPADSTSPPSPPPVVAAPEPMTAEQFTELKSLWKQSGYPPADFITQYIAPHGTQDPSALTYQQAASVIRALGEKITGPTPHDATREWAAKYSATRDEMMAENGGNVTNGQLQRLQALFQRLGATPAEMGKIAAQYKVESFKHLTLDQADEIIDKLLKIELGISQTGAAREPGDESENEIGSAFSGNANGKGGNGQAVAA